MAMIFPNPLDLIMMNRGGNPGDGFRERQPPPPEEPQPQPSGPPPEENKSTNPLGYVSMTYNCQTADATKLCIYDVRKKLDEPGDYQIGGTYSDTEPELWFFFTTSLCHGNNHLLNLFVHHKNPGNFSIQVSNSNTLTQKKGPDDDIPFLVLPNTLTNSITYRSSKPSQNHFIKTFCFTKEIAEYDILSTLMIPIKIEINPRFVLNENIVKSVKLRHDLSRLMTKQEKTDFILESATRKQFPTHKILLAAHSSVLRGMIKSSTVTSLFIDISDTDMELLLEFIYTGTIKDVMKQDCLKLLEIADKFQLQPLFQLTQHVISEQITVSNAVEMAVVAKRYSLEELQNKVFDFIIKNPEVLKTEAWTNLKDVELAKYLFQYMHNMRD